MRRPPRPSVVIDGVTFVQPAFVEAVEAIASMRASPGNADVQENGLLILMMFSMGRNLDYGEAVIRAGVIELVVSAMTTHAGHAGVQLKGCYALSEFASFTAENGSKVAERGGIEVVVAAMRRHTSDGVVQIVGCIALESISTLLLRAGREGGGRRRH